jgi:hypothetical protein
MLLPEPFAYPMEAHVRKHAPAGYKGNKGFKPWLRDEFTFRCVYCLQRETWSRDGSDAFSVDHIIPVSEDPTQEFQYDNMLYACTRCNSARQETRVIDPIKVAIGEHLRVNTDDGSIIGLSDEGRFIIRLLRLDNASARRERLRILRILNRRTRQPDDESARTDFLEAFGYPEDLPDLARKKPRGGNALKENAKTCFLRL